MDKYRLGDEIMLTMERLLAFEKDDLPEASKDISREDLGQLVELLSEKDDTLRYHSFLLLKYRSEYSDDVYPYWAAFCEKLKSMNSYQRSIGAMLIAANARWDTENKTDSIIDEYMSLLHDEKPITVRQCIQALSGIVQCKNHLHGKIAERLISFNMDGIRETMQKPVLMDILAILSLIRKEQSSNEIDNYVYRALSGGVLDKKSKKQVEAMLQGD